MKCNNTRCKTCPVLYEFGGHLTINNVSITLNENVNCNSNNIIYLIKCSNCSKNYIGKTKISLRIRNNLHRNHIDTDYGFLPVSKHIKSCGNKTYNITIIQQVKSNDPKKLDFIEDYFIK